MGKNKSLDLLNDDVCLLGFSGSYLSLVLNTLKDIRYEKKIKILKNIDVDDKVPFNCGFEYEIFDPGEYKKGSRDTYQVSVSNPEIKEKIFNHFFEKQGSCLDC